MSVDALGVFLQLQECGRSIPPRPNPLTLPCIQLHLKKIEYHEKGQYFLSLISESETHILYRFITHRVKYFKPLFREILMIMASR